MNATEYIKKAKKPENYEHHVGFEISFLGLPTYITTEPIKAQDEEEFFEILSTIIDIRKKHAEKRRGK